MKRILIGALVAVGGLAAPSAVADAAGATVDRFPVEWTVTADRCDQLPAGMTVTGTGDLIAINRFSTTPSGTTKWIGAAHATGTAVDNVGNQYQWSYTLNFNEETSAAAPAVFTGRIVDSFVLGGPGPAAYVTGFSGVIEEEFGVSFGITPTRVLGDPFDFPSGGGRCDPI